MRQVTHTWIASLLFGALTAVLGCSQDDSLQDPQLELPPQASSNQAVAVPEIELVTLIDSSEIYRVAGEYEKSLQCLEVVWRNYSELQSHRTRDQYHDAVGNLAFTTEAYDASLTAQMARFAFMDDNPFFSAVPMRISHALKKAGDTVKAIQWYRRTITSTAAPERIADARRNLAWLYISQKMYDSVLHNLVLAEDVLGPSVYVYDGAKAWTSFIEARAYASLGMRAQSQQALERGVYLFESTPSYLLGDPNVWGSLCSGVNADSARFIEVGITWAPFQRRLKAVKKRADDLAPASITVRKRKVDYGTQLNRILRVTESKWLPILSSITQVEYLTDVAQDQRRWQWITSLAGAYLRLGSQLIDVAELAPLRTPLRSATISGSELVVRNYRSVRDTINLDRIVWQNTDSTAWLQTVSHRWRMLPWVGEHPTAVVPMLHAQDSLLFFYGDRIGRGTTYQLPIERKRLHTNHTRPWTDTVTHAAWLNPTTVILGTTYGVWLLDPFTYHVEQLHLQPQGVNSGNIRRVVLIGDSLLYTHEYEATHRHRIRSMHPVQVDSGIYIHQVRPTLGHPRTDFLPLRIRDLVDHTNEVHNGLDLDHVLPLDTAYISLLPGCLAIKRDQPFSLMLSELPPSLDLPNGQFNLTWMDSLQNVGVITPEGLLIGTDATYQRTPGGTIVAYAIGQEQQYHLGSDGARIVLSGLNRSVRLIIGRPAAYGLAKTSLSVRTPWNDSTILSATGETITLTDIPAGEHEIELKASDQRSIVPIVIDVEPTLAESTWFRVMTGATLLTLFVVGFQYVKLRRKRQQELREKDCLEERVAIGRDLHDAVGAELVRINMLAKTMAEHDTGTGIQRAVREANRNLRDVIWSVAEVHQLDAVVAILAERVRTTTEESGLEAHIMLPLEIPQLNVAPQVLRDITLIVTEALTNAIKHSRATVISYDVQVDDHGVSLRLEDNGAGFDIESPKTGLGVESMRQRALRSGLDLSVVSQGDKGTTVRLTLPNNNL